jgi:hypothetical protein
LLQKNKQWIQNNQIHELSRTLQIPGLTLKGATRINIVDMSLKLHPSFVSFCCVAGFDVKPSAINCEQSQKLMASAECGLSKSHQFLSSPTEKMENKGHSLTAYDSHSLNVLK